MGVYLARHGSRLRHTDRHCPGRRDRQRGDVHRAGPPNVAEGGNLGLRAMGLRLIHEARKRVQIRPAISPCAHHELAKTFYLKILHRLAACWWLPTPSHSPRQPRPCRIRCHRPWSRRPIDSIDRAFGLHGPMSRPENSPWGRRGVRPGVPQRLESRTLISDGAKDVQKLPR
jgi:hypothetical protein